MEIIVGMFVVMIDVIDVKEVINQIAHNVTKKVNILFCIMEIA